jgi:hypothetical protein
MRTIRFIRAIYFANKSLLQYIGQAFFMAIVLAVCVILIYMFQ